MTAHDQYQRVAVIDRYWESKHRESRQYEAAAERAAHAEEMERMADATKGAMDIPQPELEAVYAFLRDNYRASRFEGMNAAWPHGVPGGGSYAELIARNCLERLAADGADAISHFDSRDGRALVFDRALRVLNPDAPREETPHRASDW